MPLVINCCKKGKTKCRRNVGIAFKNQEKNSFCTEEMFALYSAQMLYKQNSQYININCLKKFDPIS